MSVELLFLIPFGLIVLLWLGITVYKQFRLRDRTIDEVRQFIQGLDWEELQEIFDIAGEAKLMIFSSGYCLRRTMRVRIHTAREFTRRMHNNVLVLQEWVTSETEDLVHEFDDRRTTREQELGETLNLIVGLRAALLIQMFKLTLWIMLRADKWPVRRLPSVAHLRKCGHDYDLIENYQSLREAAADIALRYGQRFHDELHAAF